MPAGEVGQVVITTLDNAAMPLVRYAIGDMAIAPSAAPCPCGRPGMVVPRILGRQVPLFEVNGVVVSPWGVIARMHEIENVRQFQLLQPERGSVLALIRPHQPGEASGDEVRRLIAEQLGPSLRVEVREVERMDPLTSGKAAPALAVAPDADSMSQAPPLATSRPSPARP